MSKYGEESKLIYDLEDQGGDICSLRYDLTILFSRYLSMNRTRKMRRYQIGNVFRRDNPSFKTGRLREFIQADFDICGDNLKMVNDFAEAIDEMKLLLKYAEIYNIQNLKLDLSLARGLYYYTGLIVEVTLPGTDIGSVIGGGRYDNLCSSISSHSVPCVGFSVGVSRLFTQCPLETIKYDIFVGSTYGLLQEERMRILNVLWMNGSSAETFSGKRVSFNDQMDYAEENNFKFMVCTGSNEFNNGLLKIVIVESGEKEEIKAEDLIDHLNKLKI